MAFEEIIPDVDESSEYWNPSTVGENIEGNIVNFYTDDYNNQRIVLQTPKDNFKTLPGHSGLQRFVSKLKLGEYIKVELSDIKKSTNPDYNDTMIYKVLKDPELFAQVEAVE